MVTPVRISNSTDSDMQFGSRTVPAGGFAEIPYSEYISVVAESNMLRDGLSVDVSDVGLSDVSVRDFGALGNGFSDDTYAVQSAVDYVASRGGGIVRFPIGVYPVGHISVIGNVSLRGESRLHSVVRALRSSSGAVLSIEGADASISDMRFVV